VLRAVGGALVAIAFVGFMAWTQSMWVRGRVAAFLWDGKSTFFCAGNVKARIAGRTISLPNGAAPSSEVPSFASGCSDKGCPLIEASGNCELEIADCKLSAPTVLYATGNARVHITNSTLDGKINRAGGAEVTGLPELDAEQAKVSLSKKFGEGACNGVVECYTKADEYGNIAGRLTVAIGADGRATDARYKGAAPKKVVDCLVALGRAHKIGGFDGKPGTLSCDWAGSITPGSLMLSSTPSFTR
jgi:hypothetical protein